MRPAVLAALLLAPMFLPRAATAAPDPLEVWNRHVHGFNGLAQRHALGPAVEAWRAHVPPAARQGIGGVVGTLGEPVAALSALAAGDLDAAWIATARFGINATLGWAGWRDAATERGYARRMVTPGDAACAWGVPSGPYLVLPLLGPTSLRDATAALGLTAAMAASFGAAP
ncbi:MlaA family lipoprotein, partial [Falsiroseomonas oryziterrae]|uniref:MlaA family lipoprotein n=1 Tax=Falsiroseomonas oryziterrae TaxID=2911368 RepID=UPI001F31E295